MINEPVLAVIDDFLDDEILLELMNCLDQLIWANNYSQKGRRSSIVFKNNNYLLNVKRYTILEKVRKFIFSKKNILFYFQNLNNNGSKFTKEQINFILERIDINSTEKGLSNSLVDKILAKYLRNNFYKFNFIKKISRFIRRTILGKKYRITFSLNSTNGCYSEAPHIDIQNKVIVGLLYLDTVSVGNTSNLIFWRNHSKKLKFDKDLYVIDSKLEKFKNILPKKNRLVIFKNDKNAIHSARGNILGERRFIYFSIVSSREFDLD